MPEDLSRFITGPDGDVVASLVYEVTLIKKLVEQTLAPSQRDWFTFDEIAAKIGRSKRYVQEQVAAGTMLSVEPGKISKRHYERWLEDRDRAAEERSGQLRVIQTVQKPKRRSTRNRGK